MNDCRYQFSEHKDKHIVIEASAGTGKTYTIENMIPQFIEGGISIEKIAVLTFTEKAAAELQDRIRTQLIKQIQKSSDESKIKLEDALDVLPNANIGTIHHFCRSLLKKHSLELGFSAKFAEIRDVREEIETYFKKFWGKIEKDDSQELIELLQKIEFSKFKEILIELTEKSGGNKIQLLKKENSNSIEKDFLKLKSLLDNSDLTSKKTEYSLKLQSFQSQKFSNDFEMLSSIKNVFLTKDSKTGKTKTYDAVRKFIADKNSISHDEFEELILKLKLNLENSCAIEIINPIFEYANLLIEDYERYLISQDTISLDGLILQARKLVSNPEIRKKIQNLIQYIILDECQDTNPIQIDLVTKLFEGLNTGIIFVGDPKQSIYRFRNADLISYSAAVNSLNSKEELRLDTSFRSSNRLMQAFNFIFPKFENFQNIYKEVNANRALDEISKKNAPPLLLLGLDKNNIPKNQDEEGNPFKSDSLRASAMEEIASVINTITDNEKYLIGDKEIETGYRKIKFSDIAILSNSNSSLNSLLREFSKRSISANIYKSHTFYSHKIVQAISHLLHAVENPNDSSSLYKTLASDLFLVPEVILYQLSETNGLSYLFNSSFPEVNSIFESLRKAHENRYTKDVSYTLQEILRENRILEVISIGFEGKRNLANIYHLSEILSYAQLTENLSFGEIVRKLKKDVENSVEQEIKLDNDKKDDSFNSVQLMTIHASKGLEFPVCILYDLAASPKSDNTSLFINDSFLRENPLKVELKLKLSSSLEITTPGFQEKFDENGRELLKEKARLLYVAFTRAKDYLVLPLHTFDKLRSNSLRSLIDHTFSNTNIQELFEKSWAENFHGEQKKLSSPEKNSPEKLKETNSNIQVSTLTSKDISNKAGIKIQSYSSIARDLEPEEEFIKEKVAIEKNAKPETEDTSPIPLSSEKRGTTFGLLCHAVMENFNLKLLGDEQKLEDEIKKLVNEYYPKTGLNEVADYTSQDAITFCLATLTKSYPMNETRSEFAKIKDWKYLTREKSFFYKLKSSKMDYLIGIGDGMFYWNNKYYLLDWKTNLLKGSDGETIDEIIQKKVKESYRYQYMIYSMNLIDNITPKGQDKKEVWENKFGGMLFIFMRVTEDNQGSLLVKPNYEEIVTFKGSLEKLI